MGPTFCVLSSSRAHRFFEPAEPPLLELGQAIQAKLMEDHLATFGFSDVSILRDADGDVSRRRSGLEEIVRTTYAVTYNIELHVDICVAHSATLGG